MAKARNKGKNEEQKGDNSEAVIRHQKLCLSIDMDKRRIYGYTELDIVPPENGILGLHADNLVIDSVTVDGEPTEFEVFPHYLPLENGDRWCSVSSTTSAADAAGSVYLSSLDRELVPNLLIMCRKSTKDEIEKQEVHLENGEDSSAENNQNVKKVRIDYWVEKAETGIHFDGDVLHTDNQIRRARCWFPCMDDNLQCCCYDLEFTVASNLVAVSTGTLLYQIWTEDVPARKTYVYRLSTPVSARWISLAVAPFEILPDHNISQLSHICLSADSAKLRHTGGFFHSAFSYYEDYLSASFPFASYSQVFISPEMAISSLSLGASLSIFSSQLLFDEKVIDKTIETRIKLAYALARQWFGVYITPEAPNDDWLLDGLAGFLTDIFIKRFLGNNEARYRRYKANIAVCRADDSGATALSAVASSKNLYGTHCIGFFGKIRSWKSVAILQMLEKQMGPESFRKILQQIVSRAQDANRSLRTLSTKEFRHLANKVGNLERPFLKEFFPRWVGSCGCPVLKMGFSYNKRKNMFELAILRECTARVDSSASMTNGKPDSEKQEGDVGWPGMMSIRVHELDGMYDHPILPMTGEPWQLLEIQCHSRLAAKRFQKPKKGSKPDGSDDNGDVVANVDTRATSDSPLLWLRADPELEYLAEIHFNQPVQMWINQLERDRDVVAQAQAIATLEALPQLSFSVVNALNNFLSDSKAFWRIRIEAAFALASTASEETDWAGLIHLITFYKTRRFDANIGLPKPNDFRDFQEYFVLEAIPHAIAMVRAADQKSPREAVEFVLQLLKYNDNSGNPYSDVFWLAALVQSIGELEFGQQSIVYLSSLLKRVDRLLQFDRLMPSYNGILTISCIRSLTQIGLKLSEFVPLDRVIELINPFRTSKTLWKVRVEASRSLLDLEFQGKGIDAALTLFIRYLDEEPTIRGQVKLGVHAMRLCQIRNESDSDSDVKGETLVALLRLLESPTSFNNVILRHYLFCILQVLARRAPTLYGVPRDGSLRMGHAETCSELKKFFAALVKQSKPSEPSLENLEGILDDSAIAEAPQEANAVPGDENAKAATSSVPDGLFVPEVRKEADDALLSNEITNTATGAIPDSLVVTEVQNEADSLNLRHEGMQPVGDLPLSSSAAPSREEPILPDSNEQTKPMVSLLHETAVMSKGPPAADILESHDQGKPVINHVPDSSGIAEPSREPDTVSASHERKKPVFKIKVKKTVTSSRAKDHENVTMDKSQDGFRDVDRGASSSVSVDAPQRNVVEILSSGNHFPEDVNSCHDVGSHVTASIGSVKVAIEGEELTKELQCTAESSKVSLVPRPDDHLSTGITRGDDPENEPHKYASLHLLTMPNLPVQGKVKEKKKDRGKKRKLEGRKDDLEYLERKRLKKEKKRKEKELAKLLQDETKASTSVGNQRKNKQRDAKAEAIRNDHHKASSVGQENRKDEAELRQVMNGVEAKATSSDLYCRYADTGAKGVTVQLKPGGSSGVKLNVDRGDTSVNAPPPPPSSSHKLKIRIKNRTLGKS
ncbi:transcription initiation factor TFIID subunit 2 isoform X1 [Nicotiana tabacum]|uniref:Transcription initiation factor TFIID subunit 2 n=1 Tax=Nicotiana tabacum TaxID=4097 RepID=A0A1S4D041_TOBAC|nr:PREDICTED: transcription initiation factor TFIID subunit 2-like isoform X1 [Nicotiana tabacum]